MKRAAKWALALLVLYCAAGFLLLPWAAGRFLSGKVFETFSTQSKLGNISFNPFLLTATVGPTELIDPRGKDFISWDEVSLDLAASSLIHRALVLDQLRVANPSVRVALLADGKNNFEFLVDDEQPEAEKGEPLPIIVRSLAVTGGRLAFEDANAAVDGKPFSELIYPIDLALGDFDSRTGIQSPFIFDAVTPSGAKLHWRGRFQLNPFGASGEMALAFLQLERLGPYLSRYLAAELRGQAAASLHYELSFAKGPELKFSDGFFQVQGIELNGASGQRILAADDLKLERISVDLRKRAVAAQRFALSKPTVNVVRLADGQWEAAQIAARRQATPAAAGNPAQPPAEPPAETPAADPHERAKLSPGQPMPQPSAEPAGWQYDLHTVSIDGGSLHFEDRSKTGSDSGPAAFDLALVQLKAEGISSNGKKPVTFQFSAANPELAEVDVRGSVNVDAASGAAAIKLQEFLLPALNPYFDGGFAFANGRLSADGELEIGKADNGGPVPVLLQAEGEVSGLAFAIGDSENKYAAERLAVDKLVYDSLASRLTIAEASLAKPVVEMFRKPVPAAAAQQSDKAEPTEKNLEQEAETKPFAVEIQRINVEQGRIVFTDRGVRPDYAAEISNVAGHLGEIVVANGFQGKLSLEGKLDESAGVKVAGVIAPFVDGKKSDFKVSIEDYEVTELSPYSRQFLGYVLGQGELKADVEVDIDGRTIKAVNRFVITNLELAEKVESDSSLANSLPLALSLLKDSTGTIELDVPVSGKLDDPRFSYRRILFDALGNNLLAIVKSPFSLLGSLYDRPEELSFISFAPGSAEVPASEREKLLVLRKAMLDKPGVRLKVRGAASAALDGIAPENAEALLELARSRARAVRRIVTEDERIPVARVGLIVPETDAEPVAGTVRARLKLGAG